MGLLSAVAQSDKLLLLHEKEWGWGGWIWDWEWGYVPVIVSHVGRIRNGIVADAAGQNAIKEMKERKKEREIEREMHRCIWIWKCVCGFASRQVMQTCALLTCITCPAAALLGNCQIELANRHSLHSAPSAAVAKRRPDENCIRCKLNSLIIAFHIDAKCRFNLTGQTAVSLLLHLCASSPLPAPAMFPFGCTLMHRLNAIKWLSHLLTFHLPPATSILLILLQPPARLPLPLCLFIFHLFVGLLSTRCIVSP